MHPAGRIIEWEKSFRSEINEVGNAGSHAVPELEDSQHSAGDSAGEQSDPPLEVQITERQVLWRH